MVGERDSKSPKTANAAAPRPDANGDTKTQPEIVAKTEQPATDVANSLAPPPRPGDTPDYFSQKNPSLTHEPNPFEKSFSGNGDPTLGVGAPETPGGTKLPPVASITSPSAMLPGGTTPFNWGTGGSLRAGPLSPAMLSGPQDYFGEQYARGFPTPNESSIRSGLTPGGGGSMFPGGGMPSPNTQAMFTLAQTPGAVDFHRTALRAAHIEREQHQSQQSLPLPSQPQASGGVSGIKAENKSGPFDSQHDNDAANGLFMLAQGNRNGAQQQSQYPLPPQPAHGHPAPPVQHPEAQYNGSAPRISNLRGNSEAASDQSEDSQNARPNTRGRGKRATGAAAAPTTNGRRKAEESASKAPAHKKAKLSIGAPSSVGSDLEGEGDEDEDGMDDNDNGKPKQKMTEEEKRKNFLERNRVAALKCRQRKKQWLANLQIKVDAYQQENDSLQAQVATLREEVVNLKTLLLAHKDCPVTQQQGMTQGYNMPPMDQYPQAQMGHYNAMGQMGSYHQQMIPAGSNRRAS